MRGIKGSLVVPVGRFSGARGKVVDFEKDASPGEEREAGEEGVSCWLAVKVRRRGAVAGVAGKPDRNLGVEVISSRGDGSTWRGVRCGISGLRLRAMEVERA